jgi:hypothetical protein
MLRTLQKAVDGGDPVTVRQEVDGVAAVLESHFYYEEKKIVEALDSLQVEDWRDGDPDFLKRS